MKRILRILCVCATLFSLAACNGIVNENPELKSGNTENGKVTGFDEWGFNWNAHEFHGYTVNMLLGDHYFIGFPHYKKYVYAGEGAKFWEMLVDEFSYFPMLMPGDLIDSKLVCGWNDELIDKNGAYPPNGWTDTEAWIVFDYSGEVDGNTWKSMRKLVAAKSSDELRDGIWYNSEGDEIGLDALFWSDLIVVQVVNKGEVPPFPFFYYNYNSPNGSGYGKNK